MYFAFCNADKKDRGRRQRWICTWGSSNVNATRSHKALGSWRCSWRRKIVMAELPPWLQMGHEKDLNIPWQWLVCKHPTKYGFHVFPTNQMIWPMTMTHEQMGSFHGSTWSWIRTFATCLTSNYRTGQPHMLTMSSDIQQWKRPTKQNKEQTKNNKMGRSRNEAEGLIWQCSKCCTCQCLMM